MRTCVACRQPDTPEAMVRVVVGPDGKVAVDLAGGGFGRGAWVHDRPTCIARAAPAGLARSLRTAVKVTPDELWLWLRAAGDRRAAALVSAAHRAGKLAVGSTAVEEAVEASPAALVVVAADARAAARSAWVQRAIREGRAVAYSSKAVLGRVIGRTEVAVAAVLDEGLAKALARAIRVAQAPAPNKDCRIVEVDASAEVG